MPDHSYPCKCREKRVDNGRRYHGEGECIRCGGRFGTPRPRSGVALVIPTFSRLWFTDTLISDLRVVFIAAGLRSPSQYKGLGGGNLIPETDPLHHFSVGYVEGLDRLLLADRLSDLGFQEDLFTLIAELRS